MRESAEGGRRAAQRGAERGAERGARRRDADLVESRGALRCKAAVRARDAQRVRLHLARRVALRLDQRHLRAQHTGVDSKATHLEQGGTAELAEVGRVCSQRLPRQRAAHLHQRRLEALVAHTRVSLELLSLPRQRCPRLCRRLDEALQLGDLRAEEYELVHGVRLLRGTSESHALVRASRRRRSGVARAGGRFQRTSDELRHLDVVSS